jgi:hypothetical protein
MKSVSHIFGGEAKVKVMRLFVFNRDNVYSASTVAERTKEKSSLVRKELLNLSKAGLIRKRAKGYTLNDAYRYLPAVEHFLIDASPLSQKEIIKKLARAGNLKLLLVSGVFVHDPEARVDLLVVGDHLKQGPLHSAISALESEIGRELRYAAFETPDFRYRLGIYDKLIRDILDYPHEKLVNKLGV